MKYVIILGDGMADEPIEELGGSQYVSFGENGVEYVVDAVQGVKLTDKEGGYHCEEAAG